MPLRKDLLLAIILLFLCPLFSFCCRQLFTISHHFGFFCHSRTLPFSSFHPFRPFRPFLPLPLSHSRSYDSFNPGYTHEHLCSPEFQVLKRNKLPIFFFVVSPSFHGLDSISISFLQLLELFPLEMCNWSIITTNNGFPGSFRNWLRLINFFHFSSNTNHYWN